MRFLQQCLLLLGFLLLSSLAAVAAPTISTLTPNTGALGSSVVIAGSGYGTNQSKVTVTFNGTTATITSFSSTSITATVPTGATTGNVVVKVNGAASNGVPFTVTPAPSIGSLTPSSGAVGSSIVIAGSNFNSQGTGSKVTFNGTNATITSWSTSSITATLPIGATTGNVVVTAAGGVASVGASFAVTAAPSISSLTPNSGAVGSAIVIAGSNFNSQGTGSKVTFNGTNATITSWSTSSITATVPTGATTGNVVVTADGGVASNGVSFTVTPAPSIGSLTPSSGAVGSSIVIAGSNFNSQGTGSKVTFNGTNATITSWSTNSVTAAVPTGATTGNVAVTADGGVASPGVAFAVTAAPSISSLAPSSGAVNSAIVIAGSNFNSQGTGSKVTFNGTNATITSWSTSSITATVPTGATTGNVVVTAAGGVASGGVSFTVTPTPSISSLTPNNGAVSSSIVIAGSSFNSQGTGSKVTFNGTNATITSWSTNSVTAAVPTGATTGNVVVTADGGVASPGVPFTVTAAPSVSSLAPSSGALNSSVVISGSNFNAQGTGSSVTFNGVSATITSWSTNSITATVPTGATTGNVVVTAAGGVASNGVSFTVTPAPGISSLTPNAAAMGASIVIAGSNFNAQGTGSAVTFNGVVATITSWTTNSITATVPTGATTGNVVVTANGGVSSNGANFTLLAAPVINSVTPSSGEPGASITITGNNFTTTVGTVTFNGKTAPTTDWSNNSITAVVPNAASSGNVVVSLFGAQSNSVSFTVLTPAISSLNPVTGAPGTVVTINGSNFGGTPGTVTFPGQMAVINSWSDSTIQAVVPADASSGNVVVGNGGLESNGIPFSVLTQVFTGPINYSYDEVGRLIGAVAGTGDAVQYNYDPVGNILAIQRYGSTQEAVFAFSPQSGPVGTNVTISGSNFSSSASQDSVAFNGTGATVLSASTGQLVVSVPSGATTGPLTVTSPAGTATTSDSFTVTNSNGRVRIDSFSPTVADPGTLVTINGANFDLNPANDRLIVNITPGLNPASATSTSLTMNAPGSTGSGRISLSAPNGTVTSGDLFLPPPGFTAATVGSTGRTTPGTGALVTLNTPNQAGVVVFDGGRGQLASVVASGSTFPTGTCSLVLLSPGNTVMKVVSGCGSSGASNLYIPPQALSATGTYAAAVESNGTTGHMTLTPYVFTDVKGTITNDGTPVTVGTTAPGQKINLTFSGTAGQLVSVLIDNNTFTTFNGISAQLLAPDGTQVGSEDFDGTSTMFLDRRSLPLTGTYTIQIAPELIATGQVRVRLFTFNDVNLSGTLGGAAVPITIATPGQNATVNFPGTQGGRVSIVFNAASFTGELNPSLNFSVLNPDGSLFAGPFNGGPFNFPASATSGFVDWNDVFTFPSTGTYQLFFDPQNDTTGALTLSLYDATDVNLNINADGTQHSFSTTSPGQNAHLNFTPTVGQKVSAMVTNIAYPNQPDLVLERVNSPGNVSNVQFSGALGSNRYLAPYTFSQTGTYYLFANPQNQDTGSETVTLYTVPPDVTGTIDTVGDPFTITTSAPGQLAEISFSATQGQTVTLVLSNGAYPAGTCTWNFLRPDQSFNYLRNQDCSGTGNTFTVNISETGTWVFEFVQQFSTVTSSVTLSATAH